MNHVFGIRRRGEAGLLMRGSNGRAIRQHLGNSAHNHMRRGGQAFIFSNSTYYRTRYE